MFRTRLWIYLSVLAMSGCGEKRSTVTAPSPKNVLVTEVRTMDAPVQMHEFGRVSSPQNGNVQPQVSGRITEVHFVEGQDVKKGIRVRPADRFRSRPGSDL